MKSEQNNLISKTRSISVEINFKQTRRVELYVTGLLMMLKMKLNFVNVNNQWHIEF